MEDNKDESKPRGKSLKAFNKHRYFGFHVAVQVLRRRNKTVQYFLLLSKQFLGMSGIMRWSHAALVWLRMVLQLKLQSDESIDFDLIHRDNQC